MYNSADCPLLRTLVPLPQVKHVEPLNYRIERSWTDKRSGTDKEHCSISKRLHVYPRSEQPQKRSELFEG